jgi:2,3-bisphosphoglycerate-independent phosphoglycerate mutase
MIKNGPFLLMILDGVGINDDSYGNAFHLARKPNIDKLVSKYPNSRLESSGLAVGLPEGQMGNSEVGHANIGSGRIVYQELTRINKSIRDGDFYTNESFLRAIDNSISNNKTLHLIGLLSDGGVHSHQNHLFALLKLAKDKNVKHVNIHVILDGRDTLPSSGISYLKTLQEKISEVGIGRITTISGRYYAMDRDNRWDRTKLAYDAIVNRVGEYFDDPISAIEQSYSQGIFDEFVKPMVINEGSDCSTKVTNGDSVIIFNFRPDRSRQLTRALGCKEFTHFDRSDTGNIQLVTMTSYDSSIGDIDVAFLPQSIENSLGEYLSKLGHSQLRIAETEKYAHVTFFFNGGVESSYDNEDRIMIPSPDVSTYDQKPEMSAHEVSKNVLDAINSNNYDLIVVNFANGDMVGHTGKLDKTIEAVEALDKCVGEIIDRLLAAGGEAIISADHGNCEYMIDSKTSEIITSHSVFDVPIIVISDRVSKIENGKLCDISPTLLAMMGVDIPKEMTGHSIIELNKEVN